MAKDNDEKQPIIIKRIKKGGDGHHGGAWKVAYADFVTAMMAFFLLLWLLNVTTAQQKTVISSYFSPTDPRISQSDSGSGGVMGGTTISPEGAKTSDEASITAEDRAPSEVAQTSEMAEAQDREDKKNFDAVEDQIKQAIETTPDLKALAQNLIIDMTPEGLRIQIVDQQGKPMFELGKAVPLPHTVQLLTLITNVVKNVPNQISVRGHTDSKPYGPSADYTNWELSGDRANASRRVMMAAALSPARVENVQGKADREPLVQNDPESPRNRRISIILLKQSLVASLKKNPAKKASGPVVAPPKKQEEGVIYFP